MIINSRNAKGKTFIYKLSLIIMAFCYANVLFSKHEKVNL